MVRPAHVQAVRNHSSRRLFGIGPAVFLALLCTSALFAAPFIAAHLDFGHRHPPGTPAHVHPISSVLNALPLEQAPSEDPTSVVLFLIPLDGRSLPATIPPYLLPRPREPPLA